MTGMAVAETQERSERIRSEEEESLGYSNAVSTVVRNASQQLARFDEAPVDFRLVWLHARNRYPDDQLERFKATLFGSVDLIDLQELSKSVPARPCFYFSFSEFFRFRDVLDGAFVSTDHHGLLCVNTLSPRHRMLAASRLATSFQPGICDPVERETRGEGYIADCDISRKDKTRVLDYVKQKYKRPRLVPFEPKHCSATVLGPTGNQP